MSFPSKKGANVLKNNPERLWKDGGTNLAAPVAVSSNADATMI
jgi:hypothetical protein